MLAERFAPISRREVALLIGVGLALRVLWMILAQAFTATIDLGEASNAALAFARTGTIADAYFPGQGPTAHLLPTMIVIAGSIERLFGPGTAGANLALAAWSLAQVAAGFVLTTEIFRRLGGNRATLLGGLAILCLVPGLIAQEAADFRYWEGALAYDLAAANLLWLIVLSDRAVATRDLVVAAVLSACAFFVSPPIGVAIDLCWAVFALRHWPLRRILRFALLAALAVAALLVPWALRNRVALGETVLLRSNFGLELAIANYDGAVDPARPASTLQARMHAIHPYASDRVAQRMQAMGGELAYSRALGEETRAWIATHPASFARLAARHYRQFYVPDTWQGYLTTWGDFVLPRIIAIQLVSALGLLGLLVGLATRHRGYRLFAGYIAVAGLPYALVQPIPRYSYIVYPLLAFLAARLLVDLATLRQRKSAA